MRMPAHWTAVLVLAGAACAGSGGTLGSNTPVETKTVSVGQDFELSPGQAAVVDGGVLSVVFVKVAEDSRCPTGVQCIWAGNGAVALTANGPSTGLYTFTLNTTLSPRSVKAGPYEISLVGLKPYPKGGSTIPSASYVATLHLTRQ